MLHSLVIAQDLEDDFLKIAKTEAVDDEEDFTEEEEALDDILSNYKISEKRVSDVPSGNVDLVGAKKEQLSLVVRRAYYQKLTTPKWASVLAADSWKESFLKWRYYAQLRNYISNIDSDLTYFKMNKPIAALAMVDDDPQTDKIKKEQLEDQSDLDVINTEIASTPVEEVENPVLEIEKEEVTATSLPLDEVTEEIAQKDVAINQAIASEEDWENNEDEIAGIEATNEAPINEEVKEVIEGKKLEFSLAQLTLSEEIASERDLYDIAQQLIKDSLDQVAADEALAITEAEAAIEKEEREKEAADRRKTALAEKKKAEKKSKKESVVVAVQKQTPPKKKQPITTSTPVSTPSTNTTATTYSTAGVGNRTITAASVAPSTAPRTISAGRQAQTAGFVRRKGKLSWPVMSGTVSDRYGIRANAAARGLKARNNGVDLQCPTGTSILSVHSGTVMMVAKQAPYDHIITIKHGDYTSAYYYINRPSVRVGDVVAMGQRLGRLIGGDGEALFHFELWEGQNKVDPEIWLAPR